jgi:hypothetical protein
MNLYYTIEKYDETGLLCKTGKRRARSFVKAFLYLLYNRMYAQQWSYNSQTENTSGTPKGMLGYWNYRSLLAPESANVSRGRTEWGIVVGTSSSPVQAQHYCLQSKIANGWSSGQLIYGPHMSDESVTSSEPNASFNISRIFKNASGGDVAIREIGYYIYTYSNEWSYFCLMRDVVDLVTVSDSQYIKVNYMFQITV